MRLSAGWLAQSDSNGEFLADIWVPRFSQGTVDDEAGAVWPTRIEEYRWLAQQLEHWPRGKLLSVGAGFNPEIHVLEYVLANMGYDVVAVDENPRALHMPHANGVQRVLADLCVLPFAAESFDVWTCVSVLEHLSAEQQTQAFAEAFRVLKPGGIALLTTDETEPAAINTLAKQAGFLTGSLVPFGGHHLSPRVAWTTLQKPL